MDSETTYRVAWRIHVCSVLIGAFIGTAAFIAEHGVPGVRLVAAVFTSRWSALPMMVAFLFGLIVLLRFTVFVRVSPEGIRSLDTIGRLRTIPWSRLHSVKPTNILGIKYLRVYSQTSRFALWVPLQLSEYDRFVQHVRSVAPASCPIVASLPEPA